MILGEITALEILKAMKKKGLTGISLFYYLWEKKTRFDIHNRIAKDIANSIYKAEFEKEFITITNKETGQGFLFFLGQELMTQGRWHVLSLGATGLNPAPLRNTMETILEKGGLGGIDHGGADPDRFFAEISLQREAELRKFCEEFPDEFFIELNGYCIPELRKFLGFFTKFIGISYGDCNDRMKNIAKEYSIPAVASTDLHIWSSRSLEELGSFRIQIPRESFDFCDPFGSLKKNILEGNFQNQMQYVHKKFFVVNYMMPFFINLTRDETKLATLKLKEVASELIRY